ncbi:MAG: ion transporter [Allorhizobium sp.]
MLALRTLIESKRFETAITLLILANAVTLGLETSPAIMRNFGLALHVADHVLLGIFVLELLAKLLVYRRAFFREPWRAFDLVVIAISIVPSTESISILRALRVIRLFRLISAVPSMRRVVGGLFSALPGMGSIFLLLSLVFYVSSVAATKLFAADFPELFGTIATSAFTLFQVMTLEGWTGEVVRPIMAVHPLAWVFFIPFIVATSFTVLNLFIGIIVSSMQSEHEIPTQVSQDQILAEQRRILEELRDLRHELAVVRRARDSAEAEVL